MPLFYNDLVPLSSDAHGDWQHPHRSTSPPYIVSQHAIPLTVEEFTLGPAPFPIVFSVGDNPVPFALMGLNEGVNVFFDAEGKLDRRDLCPRLYPPLSVPARPARPTPRVSLCFDPTSSD